MQPMISKGKDKNVTANVIALNDLLIMFLLRLFEMAVNVLEKHATARSTLFYEWACP
jgi:hypothetical protein